MDSGKAIFNLCGNNLVNSLQKPMSTVTNSSMDKFEKFEPTQDARFKPQFIEGTEWLVVRATRNWFVIPFISVWLIGWTIGGISAFTQFLAGEARLFLAVWLVGWVIGWVFAVIWLGWQLAGRMRITTRGRALLFGWNMPLLAKTKRYDIQQIQKLRAGGTVSLWGGGMMNISYPPFMPGMPGSVQFDYGGRTVNVMPGLDQAEGQAIADWLNQRLPN